MHKSTVYVADYYAAVIGQLIIMLQ